MRSAPFLVDASWPPPYDEHQLHLLTRQARAYALSNGLLVLTTHTDDPIVATHQPFSLLPTPFIRDQFQIAQRLQSLYQALYARISLDDGFLSKIFESDSDPLTVRLWSIWKDIRSERTVQPLQLGIIRSDYLLHDDDVNKRISLKQVEINTLSAASAFNSQSVSGLHQYLCAASGLSSPPYNVKNDKLPQNDSANCLIEGLAISHKAYNVKDACILFVVLPGEPNLFDQRNLEFELQRKYSIRVVRQTFQQLRYTAGLDDSRTLFVFVTKNETPVEVSTVYYRAGTNPPEYTCDEDFETRRLLERSKAIKCPSLGLQLAGSKKVQQFLTCPGVVESLLLQKPEYPEEFSAGDVRLLRDNWMGMWPLDETIIDQIQSQPELYVLKPSMRDGGGHNVYGKDIPSFLKTLNRNDWAGWIVMEMISPPRGASAWFITNQIEAKKESDVVSELGIYGWMLFSEKGLEENRTGGYLVRTKRRNANEILGHAVYDSIIFTD